MVDQINSEIVFENEAVDLPDLPFSLVKKWIQNIADLHEKELGNICYVFCNDDKILEVNKQFLNHDYYTDIITFDYCEGSKLSGDLFISLDTVKSNSEKYKVDYTSEILRVVIHGILHLCGLKDKSDEDAKHMRKAENEALLIYNSF